MSLTYVSAQDEYISDAGLVMYWVVFGLMACSAIGFAAFTWTRPVHERSHGYCTTLIVTIAATAYFSMAAWGGSAPITTYTDRGVARPIYWARYVDWTFTTPLLLLDLLLIAAVPFGTAIWILFCDVLMILLGLFGATSSHRHKWGWFGLSCFFLALVNIGMLFSAPIHAYKRSKRIGLLYTGLAGYLCVTWWGYPIVWGFAEGSNTITPNAEAFCYGGLDVATKVFFGWTIIAMGGILRRQNEEEYAKGRFLPQLLAAPINGLLSMNKTEALYDPTQSTTVTHNPVAADTTATNGTSKTGALHSESHLGPHAINPGANTTPAAV